MANFQIYKQLLYPKTTYYIYYEGKNWVDLFESGLGQFFEIFGHTLLRRLDFCQTKNSDNYATKPFEKVEIFSHCWNTCELWD